MGFGYPSMVNACCLRPVELILRRSLCCSSPLTQSDGTLYQQRFDTTQAIHNPTIIFVDEPENARLMYTHYTAFCRREKCKPHYEWLNQPSLSLVQTSQALLDEWAYQTHSVQTYSVNLRCSAGWAIPAQLYC